MLERLRNLNGLHLIQIFYIQYDEQLRRKRDSVEIEKKKIENVYRDNVWNRDEKKKAE